MKQLIGFLLFAFACEPNVSERGDAGGDAVGGESAGGETPGGSSADGGSNQGGFAGGAGATNVGGSGAGGEGGATPEPAACVLHEQIALSKPTLSAGADGWQPGETATFSLVMTSPVDNFEYPGIRVEASTSLVTPNPALNTLFGISANTATPLEVQLLADASLAPGTEIALTATVVALDGSCGANAPTLSFEAVLQ
jgi:hypothetical protein